MNWFKSFRKTKPESPAKPESATKPEPPAGARPDSFGPTHNFTPRARQVLALARAEADRFNHNFVGTEHLLLGLVALGQGTAVTVLGKSGIDLENVRLEVEKQVGFGPDQKMIASIPYTPRVKKVLAMAAKEARALNHTYVGTEHILLGLLVEGDGVAARVLRNLGVELEQTRFAILKELDPNFSPPTEAAKPSSPALAPSAGHGAPTHSPVDTGKRYDVYCMERSHEVVIYRNALFKGTKSLFKREWSDHFSEFLELEQPDGKVILIAKWSIIKFCEPGVTPNSASAPKPES